MQGRYKDIVKQSRDFKNYLKTFHVDMRRWSTFETRANLEWTRIPFTRATRNKIPEARGIYAFTTLVESSSLPVHGYILYMGITGDKSEANLRSRYDNYLTDELRLASRPKVCAMLQMWKGHLFFNFAPIADKRVSLSRLEKSFLAAVVPPVNEADIEASLSAARKAAW